MYIERCKHGSGRGLYKPAAEMREGGTFLLYFKYGQAREAGFSKKEAGELSKKPWKEIKGVIEKKKKGKGGDAA